MAKKTVKFGEYGGEKVNLKEFMQAPKSIMDFSNFKSLQPKDRLIMIKLIDIWRGYVGLNVIKQQDEGGEVFISKTYKQLMELFDIGSEPTVNSTLRRLEKENLIEYVKVTKKETRIYIKPDTIGDFLFR